ncbi:MAG: HAMP domain-containing protein [Flavobacteriales bacterium]|nr:HAMP domain-containing protein [Flavobacteriales bacterium]MEB2342065.1 HAMP domain-containing protein [Flavobacteriia bacterium]
MTTRVRLSLLFAAFSLVLLVGTLGVIYISHAQSRQHEFFERLRAQCLRTATMLAEVKAADRDLLRIIDRNSIHRMYDEKVLLFNQGNELVYSSLDDEPIPYSNSLLERVRQGGNLEWRDNDGDEVVGLHYTGDGKDYVVLASAYDKYGRQELRNLLRTLIIALVLGALFIFGAGYFFIGMAFRPLEHLAAAIDRMDIDRLDQQLPVRGRKDEIDRLAVGYNAMLRRLRQAFDLQKAFVGQASHELRTPLARMNSVVEQALALPPGNPGMPGLLHTLQADISEQGKLIETLLLLQQLQAHIPLASGPVRLDEVLYTSIAEVRNAHPELQAHVDIGTGVATEEHLVVNTNEMLLRTALRNLLLNAVSYGPGYRVDIALDRLPGKLRSRFSNRGDRALPADLLFQPFFRGPQSSGKPGSGLGLSIVQQMARSTGGSLEYAFVDGFHCFILTLPLARRESGL